jgi:isopentenyldiphosphate isomerase
MSTDVLQSINSIVRLYTIFYLYNRSQTRNNTIELGHFVATEKNMIPPYPYASQELAVVSEQDNIIGSALPDIVYSRGLIHRFASVFILDGHNRLLLQKRASHKRRHGGLFSESVSAQVEFNESYLQAATRRIQEELGLISHFDPLIEICKMYMDVKEEYDDGYGRSSISNRWKKTAFVTIYKLYLRDHETIKHISINPSEISNIYILELDRVTEFYDASPGLFVPGFGFTLRAFLDNGTSTDQIRR